MCEKGKGVKKCQSLGDVISEWSLTLILKLVLTSLFIKIYFYRYITLYFNPVKQNMANQGPDSRFIHEANVKPLIVVE